jgi:hypothetical protein
VDHLHDICQWLPLSYGCRKPTTVGLLLIAMACLAGCGDRPKPLSTTYAVHGKVTFPNGQPVADAMVRFHPESEPRVVTSDVFGSDGIYKLVTKREGLQANGAVAGLNRVTVLYGVGAGQSLNGMVGQQAMGFVSTDFPTPYEVKPGENEINLTVQKPNR